MASLQQPRWKPQKAPAQQATAGQARLDRMSQPPQTELNARLHWARRFRQDPAYTSEWLAYRLQELAPLLEALDTQRWEMEPERPGAEYIDLHERLLTLRGQRQAIEDVLKARAVCEPSAVRSGGGAGLTPPGLIGALAPDPFEFE